MENEIRLVLLVIGALIILAIFWDGMRRQRKQRQQTKYNPADAKRKSAQVLAETLQLDTSETAQKAETSISLATSDIAAATQDQPFTKHGFDAPVEEEDVAEEMEHFAEPTFTEEDLAEEESTAAEFTATTRVEEVDDFVAEQPVQSVENIVPEEESEQVVEPIEELQQHAVIEPAEEEFEPPVVEENFTNAEELVVTEAEPEPEVEPAVAPVSNEPKPAKTVNQLVIFTLIAPGEKSFGGFHLLQALLNNGFRFGEDKIFHYREDNEPQGKKLFSLAAATKTGLFNLSNMAGFSCKGLVLFMNSQDHVPQSNYVFEQMVEVAEALADSLNAELRINQTEAWEEQVLAQLHAELVELDSNN